MKTAEELNRDKNIAYIQNCRMHHGIYVSSSVESSVVGFSDEYILK